MGWLLSEGTATAVILVLLTFVVSPRARGAARRIGGRAASLARRWGVLREPPPAPDHRPFELVVRDLRRLHRSFCATRTGVSFAKSDAVRRAYDDALAAGCDALGIPHLLGVLDGGDELDRERARVERLLHRWGLALDEPA